MSWQHNLTEAVDRYAAERWITIGAHPGEDGKKSGGTPVKLDGRGRIVSGPPDLHGKTMKGLKADATPKNQTQHAAKAAAKHHGLRRKHIEDAIEQVYETKRQEIEQREKARQTARHIAGLTAGDVARLENQYKDHSSLDYLDTAATTFGDAHPEMGINTPEGLWDFIRQGKETVPAKHSEEIVNEAVEVVRANRSSLKHKITDAIDAAVDGDWDDDTSFDPDRFAREFRAAVARYAQGTLFNEEDHPRDSDGTFSRKEGGDKGPSGKIADEPFSLKTEGAEKTVSKDKTGVQGGLFGAKPKTTVSPADALVPKAVEPLPGQKELSEKPRMFFKGNEAEYTGEIREFAGAKWHVVKMLEGSEAGKERLVPNGPGEKRDVSAKQKQWQEEQAGWKRLREAEQAAKKPTAPIPLSNQKELTAAIEGAIAAHEPTQIPHEMTAAEYKTRRGDSPAAIAFHKNEVKKAIKAGQVVPPEVLADFPELASVKDVPEFMKAAGIKDAKAAHKKGVTNLIHKAPEIAKHVAKQASNWIYGSVDAATNYLATEIVKQTAMQGGLEIALRSLAHAYDQKAAGSYEPGQSQRFKATAAALRNYRSEPTRHSLTAALNRSFYSHTHDVSDEARDENGQWTANDGLKPAKHTLSKDPHGKSNKPHPLTVAIDEAFAKALKRYPGSLDAKLDSVLYSRQLTECLNREMAHVVRYNAGHDVSGEPRDSDGKWTTGGSGVGRKSNEKQPHQMTSDEWWNVVKSKIGDAQSRLKIGDSGTFYRSGDLPPGNRSRNGQTGQLEAGVSVYDSPTASSFAGFADRPWFAGEGKVVAFGSDGEPIIEPTGKWDQISHESQPNAFMSAHRWHIKRALEQGEALSAEVLADAKKEYPDLFKKPRKKRS